MGDGDGVIRIGFGQTGRNDWLNWVSQLGYRFQEMVTPCLDSLLLPVGLSAWWFEMKVPDALA